MTDKFEYRIKNIITKYGGFTFRSRLEARWAAFFDIVGWKWDYEPTDLEGWSPDFVLFGLDRYQKPKNIWVEVKPFDDMPEDLIQKIDVAMKDRNSNEDVLFLGQRGPTQCDGFVSIGKLGENFRGTPLFEEKPNEPLFDFSECVICNPWFGDPDFSPSLRSKFKDLKADFCHETQGYHHRITGSYAGGAYNEMPLETARKYWGEAQTRTQFKVKKNPRL